MPLNIGLIGAGRMGHRDLCGWFFGRRLPDNGSQDQSVGEEIFD